MAKGGATLVVGGAAAGFFAVCLSLLLFVAMAGATKGRLLALDGSCGAPGQGSAAPGAAPVSGTQASYVRAIVGVGKSLGVPMKGWIIAIATALQESGLSNLANPAEPPSMALPHDGLGYNGHSLGLFQQQPTEGWGADAQVMTPTLAAEAFYGGQPVGMTTNTGLLQVPGWQSLPLAVAAQDVQTSANPGAYAHWQAEATQLAQAAASAPALPLPLPPGSTPGSGSGITPGSMGMPGGCSPSGPSLVAATPGTYYNPLRGITGLTPLRIDQGVDYAGSGPLYALGDGVILDTTSSGWPGENGGSGAYIAERLSDGPATGAVVYFAENVTPMVTVGEHVNPNTVIGILHDAGPNLEAGWGDLSGATQAAAHGQWDQADSTAYGVNFDHLLVALGVPGGIHHGHTAGSLPGGWPTW